MLIAIRNMQNRYNLNLSIPCFPVLKQICFRIFIVLVFFLLITPVRAGEASILVDCAWLNVHANDPDLRIVDVSKRPDNYEKGHIPGAVKVSRHVDLEDYTSYPPVGYPQVPQFQELMKRLAISPDTTVVAYDDNRGVYASRFFFIMRLYGHSQDRLKILDGGIKAWASAGLPLEKKSPSVNPCAEYRAHRAGNALLVSWQDVYRGVVQGQEPGSVLLDVRRPQEYSGEVVRCVRGGHIPGAVSLDLAAAVARDEMGRWKSPAALERLVVSRQVTADTRIFIYCHSGDRSAQAFVILKYVLGFPNVRIYEHAWEEWAVMQALPVVNE